jgi:hypothetical protein
MTVRPMKKRYILRGLAWAGQSSKEKEKRLNGRVEIRTGAESSGRGHVHIHESREEGLS